MEFVESVDVEFVESITVEFVESSEVVVSPVVMAQSCSWVGDEVPVTDETCGVASVTVEFVE